MNEKRWLLGQMQCDKDEGSKRMRANERERRAELLFCTPTNGHLTEPIESTA